MKIRALIALFCLAAGLSAFADEAPLTRVQLVKGSTHVFQGMVLEITTEGKDVLRAQNVYLIKVRVSDVSKGEDIEDSEIVILTAELEKSKYPEVIRTIPVVGDHVYVYANKNGDLLKPVKPNGLGILQGG